MQRKLSYICNSGSGRTTGNSGSGRTMDNNSSGRTMGSNGSGRIMGTCTGCSSAEDVGQEGLALAQVPMPENQSNTQ